MTGNASSVAPFMQMGCTNVTLTYRAAGKETICLQSPSHGVQQLVGFDPAKGDVLGLNDILELTTAQADLSDIGKYITSVVSSVGTTLYFDPTGHGLQGTPFAVLQGVNTTVVQLVANGGMKYIPDAISVTPQFNTPLTLRPAGLETVNLPKLAPGLGPVQINGFNPNAADILELRAILNPTAAAPDLSNIANYIHAATVNGNTILSVDVTGAGLPGVAFVQLNGVAASVAQLVAVGALVFHPTATTVVADAGAVFTFRPEGNETAILAPTVHGVAAPQLNGFSLAANDVLSLQRILQAAKLSVTSATLANYFSATQSQGSTLLWFDSTGSGKAGSLIATLTNTQATFADLVSAGALQLGAPVVTPPAALAPIMVMGCTNVTLTYRAAGKETICLQSPSHGVQQLAGFNPAKGDVIGLNDILELTTAQADLSDVGKYITSAVTSAGTTLYFDPTGHGLQGTPFAVLQGVNTTVVQLVANGGMKYIPDAISVTPQFNTPLTLRPAGLETVNLPQHAPGLGPAQIYGFNPNAADILELRAILNLTNARPDLSDISDYINAQTLNGNTILSVDATGAGLPGVAFAQLNGVSASVAQLMADHALVFDPTAIVVGISGGHTLRFRPEGDETVNLPTYPKQNGYATLQDFSSADGDALSLAGLFAANHVSPTLSNLDHYISAVPVGGSTALWFDATGGGHGGVEVALLQNTNVSLTGLLAAHALHIT
jgi:hypothetical protein